MKRRGYYLEEGTGYIKHYEYEEPEPGSRALGCLQLIGLVAIVVGTIYLAKGCDSENNGNYKVPHQNQENYENTK